jgi:cytochrome P450
MTQNLSSPTGSACPFDHGRRLPSDGTPLAPSPVLTRWRDEAAATPLRYADGHQGWVVTRYDLARSVLEDPRFSQRPSRMPVGPEPGPSATIDERAQRAMDDGSLLGMDAPRHSRIRRSILQRFSVRSVRSYQPDVADVVARQVAHLRAQGSPADLTVNYAQPISALVHSGVLGIPDRLVPSFARLFVGQSPMQEKVDFARELLLRKQDELGEDVLSDLLRSALTRSEVEGITVMLLTSGRDSVAYMIATGAVALLTHPESLAALRDDPTLTTGAVEELMRVGAMFVTLFPRTAKEDVTFDGVVIRAGETVSVSPVAANRDERRFERPRDFEITRDAFGHLGFGHGLHGCIGQQLARLEIREALTQLVVGFPGLALVEAEQLQPMPFAHPVATYEAGAVIVSWD